MDHMGYKIVGTLHIIVCSEKDPTVPDWTAYANALQTEVKRGVDVAEFRTLVFSDGGGPNAAMRKTISDLLQGKPSPIAIVSGSAMMRGVVTALRWFNPSCRAYSPNEVGQALDFLQVPHLKFDAIKHAALEMQAAMGLRVVAALEQARLGAGSLSSSARV